MAIHAYDETYVSGAQNILGHAVDFAVLSLGLNPDTFGNAFAVSNASKQFANGNPRYVAGINGCELARIVLTETHTVFSDMDDVMYLDKSPEYWSGWALALYQWESSYSFIDILRTIPLSSIIAMYPAYHEMDVSHFIERMNTVMAEANRVTRLKTKRINCGLSQSELASESGVALRQIQLLEQRQRDINKASAITLFQLGKVLHCRMEDLIELSNA